MIKCSDFRYLVFKINLKNLHFYFGYLLRSNLNKRERYWWSSYSIKDHQFNQVIFLFNWVVNLWFWKISNLLVCIIGKKKNNNKKIIVYWMVGCLIYDCNDLVFMIVGNKLWNFHCSINIIGRKTIFFILNLILYDLNRLI